MAAKDKTKYIVRGNADAITWAAIVIEDGEPDLMHDAYVTKDEAVAAVFEQDPLAAVEIYPEIPQITTDVEEAQVKGMEQDLARVRQALADKLEQKTLLAKVAKL